MTIFPSNDEVKAFGTTYGYGCQYNDILYRYLRDKFNDAPRATLGDLIARWDGVLTPLTTPDTLPGNVLWLDSSDVSTITDTGGAVDVWADKSPEGNDATGTGANRPITGGTTINGLNTIAFTAASSHFLNLGQPTSLDLVPTVDHLTLIIVYKVSGTSAIIAKAGATPANRQFYMFYGSSKMNSVLGGAFAATTTNPNNVIAVTATSSNDDDQTVFHNSVLEDTKSILNGSNSNDILIGARRSTDVNTGSAAHMQGEIGEIIMYNHRLTDVALVNIMNALKTKWGIT